MRNQKQLTGVKGENLAVQFLAKKGYRILTRNFFTRYGEIDIIIEDKNEIVFVEVKTRKNFEHGQPQEAVDQFKQKNLIQTAQIYLQKNHLQEKDWRIDVIGIDLTDEKNPKIEYIQNAVTYF